MNVALTGEYHFRLLNIAVRMIPSLLLAAAWPATHSCMVSSPARGQPWES